MDSMIPSAVLREYSVKNVVLVGVVCKDVMRDAIQNVYEGKLTIVDGTNAFGCDAAAGAVVLNEIATK